MPLVELTGNNGAAEFWQSGPIGSKVGMTCGTTVMESVAVVAHWPASGDWASWPAPASAEESERTSTSVAVLGEEEEQADNKRKMIAAVYLFTVINDPKR